MRGQRITHRANFIVSIINNPVAMHLTFQRGHAMLLWQHHPPSVRQPIGSFVTYSIEYNIHTKVIDAEIGCENVKLFRGHKGHSLSKTNFSK